MNEHPSEKIAAKQDASPGSSDIIKRVRIMCDLFNLAFEMKSLELARKHPHASEDWIKQDTLRLIGLGTR